MWLTARPLPGQSLRTPVMSHNRVKLTTSKFENFFVMQLEFFIVILNTHENQALAIYDMHCILL